MCAVPEGFEIFVMAGFELLRNIRPSVHQLTNMITTATAIVPVHNHPIAHSTRGSTKISH